MPFYADLHVHSQYARATSSDLDLQHMALWAAKKGVAVLGTGDFTHPAWFREIREKLVPAEPGLFRLKPELERWCAEQFPAFTHQPTRFLLEVEISTIYKKGDKTRKVHHLHYVPDLASAERFIAKLARIGNLNADGRPILGLDSRDLLEITLEAGEGAYLIPAHIWTPWFAALGSKSGFDSIEECYGDLTAHIFALETGLSSDPPMNWRLSQLDRYHLVSNSDAHSPGKIGREACKFDCALDYWSMREALRTGVGYGGTVEFFPEEGKYHLDGHRTCGVRLEPEETKKHGGLCPACGKELTVGVMHRVDELADRPDGTRPDEPMPFRSLVPLPEVLSEIHRVGAASRKVADSYEKLVSALGSELFILEHAPLDELRKAGSTLLAEGIARMREGRVMRQAGYDGEYGVIRVFTDDELARSEGVSLLFEVPADSSKSLHAVPPDPAPLTQGEGTAIAASVESSSAERANTASERSSDAGKFLPLPTGEGRGEGEGSALHEQLIVTTSITPDPMAGLDPEQRAAAESTDGPVIIIAGPGTGKTRTLTHRIAYLVAAKGIAPEHILAVTFTKRAANEMRERLRKLLPTQAEAALVTTFHGLGMRLLRDYGAKLGLAADFRIANETERRALLVEKMGLIEHKAGQLLKKVAKWKRGGRPDDEVETTSGAGIPPPCVAGYEEAMRLRGWLDFDDLIGLAVELLEQHPDIAAQCRERFGHVSVDEFQDIDEWQYRLIKLLVPAGGNLCVIGDPDQSVYSFRGAAPRFFRQCASDFPGAREVRLHRNYRSARAIVAGALQAIAPGSLVEGRVLEALNADATRIAIHEAASDKAEAEFVVHTIEKLIGGHGFFSLDSGRVEGSEARSDYSFADFAVFYRTEAQADVIAGALARSGIPFQRRAHALLGERPEVQALLEGARSLKDGRSVLDRLKAAVEMTNVECRMTNGPRDETSAAGRGLSRPTSELHSSFVIRISELASRCGNDFALFESELALLSDADLWDPRAQCVSLLTLHASKGLEFPVVFITGCEDGLLPLRFGPRDDVDLNEERRLFFVGMTRARERLVLSHAKKRLWRGQLRQQAVSPFVAAIERELLERSKAPAFKPSAKALDSQMDLFVTT